MSMTDLKSAFALVAEHEDQADFVGPRDASLIEQAELALGVRFPPTYREFLTRLGCGDIAGEEFYGVIQPNFEKSGVPDAIWMTLDTRATTPTPKSYVVTGAVGDGRLYVLDTAQRDQDDECPVLIWEPWPDARDPEIVAPSFGTFLKGSVSDALEE